MIRKEEKFEEWGFLYRFWRVRSDEPSPNLSDMKSSLEGNTSPAFHEKRVGMNGWYFCTTNIIMV